MLSFKIEGKNTELAKQEKATRINCHQVSYKKCYKDFFMQKKEENKEMKIQNMKKMAIIMNLSIITLNVSVLNIPIKIYRID